MVQQANNSCPEKNGCVVATARTIPIQNALENFKKGIM